MHEEPGRNHTAKTEQQELEAISRTLGRLHRLTLSIRKAKATPVSAQSGRFRIFEHDLSVRSNDESRTANHEVSPDLLHKFFESKIRATYQALTASLLAGLSKFCFTRRQNFLYLKHHQSNMREMVDEVTDATSDDNLMTYDNDGFSDSHASTFDPNNFVPEPAESVTSSNLEISANSLSNEDFPPAPVVPGDCEEFPCPYCFCVLDKQVFASKRRWRQHVEQDLQPYVCIYPECLVSQRAYGSISEWNKHIDDSHLAFWICSVCDMPSPGEHNPERFCRSEDLTTHLDQKHSSLSVTQKRSLIKKGQRSGQASAAFASCPFCLHEPGKDGKSRYREHIANHILDVSLLCLPERADLNNHDHRVPPEPGSVSIYAHF
jgi:hypothetical protein